MSGTSSWPLFFPREPEGDAAWSLELVRLAGVADDLRLGPAMLGDILAQGYQS
jgi:hypothetical protein